MRKPKVYLTRSIPKKGMQILKDQCDLTIWEDELPPSREELVRGVQGVDGIVSLLTDRIDAEVMDAAGSGLKVISNHAVGFDNVDIKAATERGIPVGNTPGILTDATADFTFALLMASARRVAEGERFVRDGKWKTWGPSLLLGHDVFGSTLGIIGFGRIGKAVAKRARGFDMRVIYYDVQPSLGVDDDADAERVSLDALLAESDYVSLHTPLTKDTHHLFDMEAFRRMKSTAILVNTARGPIIDPDALYWALNNGEIAYAAIDVTEPEPIPLDSPLLELENLLITPHIASASETTRNLMSFIAANNLVAGVEGKPLPHCVNPEVYT